MNICKPFLKWVGGKTQILYVKYIIIEIKMQFKICCI